MKSRNQPSTRDAIRRKFELEVGWLKCRNLRRAVSDKLARSPWDVELVATATVSSRRDPRPDAQGCPPASVMVQMVSGLWSESFRSVSCDCLSQRDLLHSFAEFSKREVDCRPSKGCLSVVCASIVLVWYLAHVWSLVCGCNKHQKHTGYNAGSDNFNFSCQMRARLSHIRVDWLAEFQSFEGCMETADDKHQTTVSY